MTRIVPTFAQDTNCLWDLDPSGPRTGISKVPNLPVFYIGFRLTTRIRRLYVCTHCQRVAAEGARKKKTTNNKQEIKCLVFLKF
jgi:hypothetical protein